MVKRCQQATGKLKMYAAGQRQHRSFCGQLGWIFFADRGRLVAFFSTEGSQAYDNQVLYGSFDEVADSGRFGGSRHGVMAVAGAHLGRGEAGAGMRLRGGISSEI